MGPRRTSPTASLCVFTCVVGLHHLVFSCRSEEEFNEWGLDANGEGRQTVQNDGRRPGLAGALLGVKTEAETVGLSIGEQLKNSSTSGAALGLKL